jgi:UBX domain-containing protein 1
LDASRPSTSIAIRLPNGKRLIVRVNLSDPVSAIGQYIGDQVGGSYVLTTEFPPATIENLDQNVEDAGLKGSQVGVEKV